MGHRGLFAFHETAQHEAAIARRELLKAPGNREQQPSGEVREDDVEGTQRGSSDIGDAKRHVGAGIQAEVLASRFDCIRVVVQCEHVRGSQSAGRDRENAGSGTNIEDGSASQLDLLQMRETEARCRVMARAESHRRLNDNGDW